MHACFYLRKTERMKSQQRFQCYAVLICTRMRTQNPRLVYFEEMPWDSWEATQWRGGIGQQVSSDKLDETDPRAEPRISSERFFNCNETALYYKQSTSQSLVMLGIPVMVGRLRRSESPTPMLLLDLRKSETLHDQKICQA